MARYRAPWVRNMASQDIIFGTPTAAASLGGGDFGSAKDARVAPFCDGRSDQGARPTSARRAAR